jgi:hypothetical protein
MKADLIGDIWSVTSEHVPEKLKSDVAQEFVTVLLDYGISESVLEGLLGIDTHLDSAVEYAIDDEDGHHNSLEDELWD